MTGNGILQIVIFLVVLLALSRPLGDYMTRVYQGERVFLDRVFGPIERLIYRAAGVTADQEMGWKSYALAMLLFNALGTLAVYLILRAQQSLPLNPQGMVGASPDLSFNTATSFASNTNWQSYGGESTLSYFSQMAALTVQNFVSAATGMAVLVALIRGITRRSATTLGSFWVDLVRTTVYILTPLSFVVISKDGKTMTNTSKGSDSEGKPISFTIVYDRQ